MTLKTSGSGAAALLIADAKQHRLGRPALFDDERPALVLDPAQELAKIGTGPQGETTIVPFLSVVRVAMNSPFR